MLWRRALTRRVITAAAAAAMLRAPAARCCVRGASSSADTADELEMDLSAYEDLLLAAAEAPAEAVPAAAAAGGTEELLAQLEAQLPADGSPARLTDVTLGVDAEAISELHGSVLSFARLFPARVACERRDGRWLLRRARAEPAGGAGGVAAAASAPAPPETAATPAGEVGLADLFAAEELRALGATPRPPPSPARPAASRVRRGRGLRSAAPAAAPRVSDDVLRELSEALPAGEAVPVTTLRARLPEDLRQRIASAGGGGCGLTRLLKALPAAAPVELSADGRTVARAGLLRETWAGAAAERATAMPPDRGFRDAWEVELNLDGDDSEEAPPLPEEREATAAAAAPKKKKTQQQQQQPARRKATPAELLAAHTALAEKRGWHTPAEMLEVFVECVPTFFVPLGQVRMTDALAKALGPRRAGMPAVMKIYSYYFEFDAASGAARLAPSVDHPNRGAADVHYAAWDPARAPAPEAASPSPSPASAFPRLLPTIRGKAALAPKRKSRAGGAAGAEAEGAAGETGAAPARPASPFAAAAAGGAEPLYLLAAARLPYDRALPLAEAAALCGATVPEVAALLRPDHDAQARHAAFLAGGPAQAQAEAATVRLRPFWLAPGSVGELSVAALPPAFGRRLRPVWSRLDRLLAGVDAAEWGAALAACGVPPGATAAEALRRFGADCWVSADGERARRYAASADLDDVTHLSVLALARRCPPSDAFTPLDDLLAPGSGSADAAANSPLPPALAAGSSLLAMLAESFASDQRRPSLLAFLGNHGKILELQTDGGRVLVRRRTVLSATRFS